MNLLNYTSKEMFSSTELIRKSKTIFDKINKKEIEKAIILRDGKPSFMLLDFETYERLMSEFISMKEKKVKNPVVKAENTEDVNNIDLEDALAQIEKLDIGIKDTDLNKEESLKEFWD